MAKFLICPYKNKCKNFIFQKKKNRCEHGILHESKEDCTKYFCENSDVPEGERIYCIPINDFDYIMKKIIKKESK